MTRPPLGRVLALLACGPWLHGSPPACTPNDAAMLAAARAVVTVDVLGVERARRGDNVRLSARYRVRQVVKGPMRAGQEIRVAASCIDQPVPREEKGYPVVERYCRGGPALTGVDPQRDVPLPAPDGGFVLFLEGSGAVWSNVSRVRRDGGCDVKPASLGSADAEAFARLQQHARRPFRLAAELRTDDRLVHHLHAGIAGSKDALARIHHVTYLFLQEPLPSTASEGAGSGLPSAPPRFDDRELHVVTERGPVEGGRAFLLRRPLQWIPRAVVAVVGLAGMSPSSDLTLEPATFRLSDPSLRVVLEPVYETSPTATRQGLQRLPQLDAVRLRFSHLPSASTPVGEVAVAIGRSRQEEGPSPLVERFPLDEIEAAGGVLTVGMMGRRSLGSYDHVGYRDYVWVLAIDRKGNVESYAAWRPVVLDPAVTAERQDAARAETDLAPQVRVAPADPSRFRWDAGLRACANSRGEQGLSQPPTPRPEARRHAPGPELPDGECHDYRGRRIASLRADDRSLRGASFEGAELSGPVGFLRADLTGASLRDAVLGDVDLRWADLSAADLAGARMAPGTRLNGARFDEHTRLPFSRAEALARGMVVAARVPKPDPDGGR